jgi:hypothetical protein
MKPEEAVDKGLITEKEDTILKELDRYFNDTLFEVYKDERFFVAREVFPDALNFRSSDTMNKAIGFAEGHDLMFSISIDNSLSGAIRFYVKFSQKT